MKDSDLSRYLSLVLRHAPEKAGITLDGQGWVDLAELVSSSKESFTQKDVERVVASNDKQRFVIQHGRIRANQGHSVSVDLGLTPKKPPQDLYHGTSRSGWVDIDNEGLKKMGRHHVHLAEDCQSAIAVGRRAGSPILLQVAAGLMHLEGATFYQSANGVWLVDAVPRKYLRELKL